MDSQQGFTLIEMIVVLVVLALIAGIVMSHGPSRSPTLEVKQAVAMVAQAMRGARAAAIAAERPVDIDIDTVRHSIRAGSARLTLLPGMVAIAAAAPFGAAGQRRDVAIRFAPDGSSSGGGIVLTEGAVRMMVMVDGVTGRVRFANGPRFPDEQ
jgi:general secretion pathway protein H